MIRQATKYDKTEIMQMMREFHAEADMPEIPQNEQCFNVLLDSIFAGQGVVFIEEGKGLLMTMVLPTIWCNKTFAMHELAWFVRPQHRDTTTGFRLFAAYLAYAKQLKEQGRIKYFTITKLDTSPELKYEKYGFRKKDENWIQ
jgi:N-acetylglutamate synthase-like GNAT family acetyltransferase